VRKWEDPSGRHSEEATLVDGNEITLLMPADSFRLMSVSRENQGLPHSNLVTTHCSSQASVVESAKNQRLPQ
jgi:hypothetical protein